MIGGAKNEINACREDVRVFCISRQQITDMPKLRGATGEKMNCRIFSAEIEEDGW